MIASHVRETSTTTGAGSITLAGAPTGSRSFDAAFGHAGARFAYHVVGKDGAGALTGEWEEGVGYLSDATTLVRETLIASSTGSAVSFSSASLDVFCGGGPAALRSGVVVESSDTITLDLARAATHTRAVAGSVTIDATNYAPGLGVALVLTNGSGSTQTVTSLIVGATWLTAEPVDLEDGEVGYLTGVSTTSAASGLVLAWVVVIP